MAGGRSGEDESAQFERAKKELERALASNDVNSIVKAYHDGRTYRLFVYYVINSLDKIPPAYQLANIVTNPNLTDDSRRLIAESGVLKHIKIEQEKINAQFGVLFRDIARPSPAAGREIKPHAPVRAAAAFTPRDPSLEYSARLVEFIVTKATTNLPAFAIPLQFSEALRLSIPESFFTKSLEDRWNKILELKTDDGFKNLLKSDKTSAQLFLKAFVDNDRRYVGGLEGSSNYGVLFRDATPIERAAPAVAAPAHRPIPPAINYHAIARDQHAGAGARREEVKHHRPLPFFAAPINIAPPRASAAPSAMPVESATKVFSDLKVDNKIFEDAGLTSSIGLGVISGNVISVQRIGTKELEFDYYSVEEIRGLKEDPRARRPWRDSILKEATAEYREKVLDCYSKELKKQGKTEAVITKAIDDYQIKTGWKTPPAPAERPRFT